jgi:hypothetical protein
VADLSVSRHDVCDGDQMVRIVAFRIPRKKPSAMMESPMIVLCSVLVLRTPVFHQSGAAKALAL